eukprot:2991644-Rhodomonas_salina.1
MTPAQPECGYDRLLQLTYDGTTSRYCLHTDFSSYLKAEPTVSNHHRSVLRASWLSRHLGHLVSS